jgi:hypothetical protein
MSLSLLLIGAGGVIVVLAIAGVLLFAGRSNRD